MKLGKLEEVQLRTIWEHEQYDFSKWLAREENINELGNVLGLSLYDIETEKFVGNYRCDILCKDELTNKIILIENQLEATNHDHLGKIITYASGLNASVIVWIVENAKEEHKAAIEWLNKNMNSEISFFLIELHVYKIGDSIPAPQFKIIQQPNDFTLQVKENMNSSKIINESMSKRLEFWSLLNTTLEERNFPFKKRKATTDHWYDFAVGSSKCHLSCALVNKSGFLRIAMIIPDNKELFDYFYLNKNEIQNTINLELEWDKSENKKMCTISTTIEGLDFTNNLNWNILINKAIDILILFKNGFKKFLI